MLLFDLFPAPVAGLRPHLVRAAARGVQVAGVIYEDVGDRGFVTALSPGGAPVVERWPGSQIGLVVDALQAT